MSFARHARRFGSRTGRGASLRHAAITSFLCLAAIALAQSACLDRELASIDVRQAVEERVVFDVSRNRDVDILFVIDNSGSMEREQISLTDKFENLINALSQAEGLPSVHIGVVSTDLGSGPDSSFCSSAGDGGRFLGSECLSGGSGFIQSLVDEEGNRSENFSGSIEETFSCMAKLGVRGCGFEQPLEAMRKALQSPAAASFLRPHAYLAVVIVSDEDDCSVSDLSLLDTTPAEIGDPLGPATGYRCFDFGVECDQDPRTPGPRTGCKPREDSAYVYPVREYVDFLHSLKGSPDQVLAGVISGELEPIHVSLIFDKERNQDVLDLDYSCTELDAEATPPVRLAAFADAFGERSARASICDADLGAAVDAIADTLLLPTLPCLESDLPDIDPSTPGVQPDCVLVELAGDGSEKRLPECDNRDRPEASTELPCYRLAPSDQCAKFPTGLLAEVVYPDGFTVDPSTRAVASCFVADERDE